MRIKLTKPTVIAGHEGIGVDKPFDCDEPIAGLLVVTGRAVRVESARIEVREPEIENRDPQPVEIKKRGRVSRGTLP